MKVENVSVKVKLSNEHLWFRLKNKCPNNRIDYNGIEKCLSRRIGHSNGYESCTEENCVFFFWFNIFNNGEE